MTRISLSVAILLSACSGAGQTPAKRTDNPDTQSAATNNTDIQLASITLADDCSAKPASGAPAPPSVVTTSEACTASGCVEACTQTSLQLAIRPDPLAAPATLRIDAVELIDEAGQLVDSLNPDRATVWRDSGYVEWDGSLPMPGGGDLLQVSYTLTAPNWKAIAGSRYQAQGKRFTVRVSLSIVSANGTTKTLQRTRNAEAYIEIAVPT